MAVRFPAPTAGSWTMRLECSGEARADVPMCRPRSSASARAGRRATVAPASSRWPPGRPVQPDSPTPPPRRRRCRAAPSVATCWPAASLPCPTLDPFRKRSRPPRAGTAHASFVDVRQRTTPHELVAGHRAAARSGPIPGPPRARPLGRRPRRRASDRARGAGARRPPGPAARRRRAGRHP